MDRRALTDALASRLSNGAVHFNPSDPHHSTFPVAPQDKTPSGLRLTLPVPFHLRSSRLAISRGRGGGSRSGGGGRRLPLGEHPAPEAAAWRRISFWARVSQRVREAR